MKIKFYFTVHSTVTNNCFKKNFCIDENIKTRELEKRKISINKGTNIL